MAQSDVLAGAGLATQSNEWRDAGELKRLRVHGGTKFLAWPRAGDLSDSAERVNPAAGTPGDEAGVCQYRRFARRRLYSCPVKVLLTY
jgi:hypothetical protein